ncbi:MAG: toxin-antitoxin system HicB family antitoxin [Planctomycetota bacterium]|nr:toxin-antitoxin system HicB family antitoxin [Planctomycetota bacterium]
MPTPGKDDEKKEGKAPGRKAFLLRLAPTVHEELREWAAQDMRSLNAQIEFLLKQALKKRKGGQDS